MGRVALALCLLGSATLASAAAIPTSWRELPALVRSADKADQKTPRAWGNPSQGVYAVEESIEGLDGSSAEVLEHIAKALEKKGFTAMALASGTARFEHDGKIGQVRVSRIGEETRIVTCFYNEREPERSRLECDALLSKSTSP